MTDLTQELADIFGNAEGHGHLDHKYAEVMFDQVSTLFDEMQTQVDDAYTAVAMMNAELAVAQAELSHLEQLRTATRIYLGVEFPSEKGEPVNAPLPPTEVMLKILNDIMMTFPNQKIQQIKALRDNEEFRKALSMASKTLIAPLGLKEAKDIIDGAWNGVLYIPGKGSVNL